MSQYTEFVKLIRNSNKTEEYSPMLGKILSLPELKIQLGSRVILTSEDVKAIFDIYETTVEDNHMKYVNLNKNVVLLPYSNSQKFIALGVIQE